MKQIHLFISGSVQGVGFRYFIKSHAKRLGVTGWVKNLPNGQVETVLQASTSGSSLSQKISERQDKARIEQMIQLCKKGSPLAKVKDMQVAWEEAGEQYIDFVSK